MAQISESNRVPRNIEEFRANLEKEFGGSKEKSPAASSDENYVGIGAEEAEFRLGHSPLRLLEIRIQEELTFQNLVNPDALSA